MPRSLYRSRIARTSASATAALLLLLLAVGEPAPNAGRVSPVADAEARADDNSFTLEELDMHPDVVFRSWLVDPLEEHPETRATRMRNRLVRDFRDFLALYVYRQGQDDNFTLRVVDNQSGELLEIHKMNPNEWAHSDKAPDAPWDWDLVDRQRRRQTRALVDKYAQQGIPRKAITVKWGRKNQVLEARIRELPYIEYEIRLAKLLGLSLLVTETGTVETFNRDDLVSSAGARGRYQIMPFLLRQNDIHRYRLDAAAGNAVRVYEERHPLLTMEAAFATIAGYRNAVGHEIPGLSAYHTGPGNIFLAYRKFLEKGGEFRTQGATVMDAYMWAVTAGFDHLASSSFRNQSRSYVAAAYGALQATDALPIDKAGAAQLERVQLRGGERIRLSRLLDLLSGPGLDQAIGYDRFREQNPHFLLPERSENDPGVPAKGNVQLVARAGNSPVRFFLPAGSAGALLAAGFDGLDPEKTFYFGPEAYGGTPWSLSDGPPSHAPARTVWDRQYDDLVQEISRFGFTRENRDRLNVLAERFESLAREEPSCYRNMQWKIIRTHRRLWHSDAFDRLAAAAQAAALGEDAEAK